MAAPEELMLPLSYVGCMVGFTLMRKAHLERYLKPHQVTIAIAVGLTVVLSLVHAYDMVETGAIPSVLLFLQALFFSLAMYQRSEFDSKETAWVTAGVGLQAALCYFNDEECDRYARLVLGAFSFVHLLSGISHFRTGGAKARLGAMWIAYSTFGLYATYICDEFASQDLTIAYLFVGLATLLIAKINHPILGDKFPEVLPSSNPDASATSASWRM